jgi:hypothetical protein
MSHSDPVSPPDDRARCADGPGPSTDADGRPLSLAEAVDCEANAYRSWGTPVGDLLARQLERLAQLIRWTGATTPEDYEARMEVWDDHLRRRWEERGYAAGREAGRRDRRYRALPEIQLLLWEGPLR